MVSFNVLNWDFNQQKVVPYDVMPYLVRRYNESKDKPKTFNEFKEFIKNNSMYQWWGRCEYEIIISDWPSSGKEEKWDVHQQVMLNIDVITGLLMNEVL